MFVVAGGVVGAMLVLGVLDLPHFGSSFHPYRDAAVPAAVAHATSNVISSVNFDLRGLDTLGRRRSCSPACWGWRGRSRPPGDGAGAKPPRAAAFATRRR